MNRKKLIKNIIGWILAVIIIFILVRTIYNNRADLQKWNWQINWLYTILSLITLMAAYICGSQGWRAVLQGFGYDIKFHESFRVVYLANLGRYLPGKVWQVLGMVGLAKELKIPPQISLASFALVQAFALPAAFVLIPLALGKGDLVTSLTIFRDVIYIFMLVVFILFLILFFKPDGLNWALNKILRFFKQEPA
ncbi:MAG: lysylphosphatidylglycerol synthase domain-containing protein, partial [candidate division Zixibacteria bacterium]|nr:lysylphosphatidylglycerol synthase domain-containing protein [candidate division Zixibacteria bacterium]